MSQTVATLAVALTLTFPSESKAEPSTASQMDELTPLPEQEKQLEAGVEAPAQSRNRRKKVCSHYSFILSYT